jgi:hypothetical protein
MWDKLKIIPVNPTFHFMGKKIGVGRHLVF